MSAIEWIQRELKPVECTSEEFFYNEMESQSGYALPFIYEPFDMSKRSHWGDRGALYDFLATTNAHEKRLLDFGPGDGWPSLIMAPYAAEIIGVEGSRRRVDVCKANADRMGITNVDFVLVEPGSPLPFEAESFDGATAASSIEQTPDPAATIREIHRVLRPSGRLRMFYEALDSYHGGKEREAIILTIDDTRCKLVVYDRDIDGELAVMYGVMLSMPAAEGMRLLSGDANTVRVEKITQGLLNEIHPRITGAQVCTLKHPSGKTFVILLREAGFSRVLPTRSGIHVAQEIFDGIATKGRLEDRAQLDLIIDTVVKMETVQPAPVEDNPPITAVK